MDSFGAAYGELLALATRRARRLLNDPEDAQEAGQEALLRAYLAWDDIEPYAPQWVSRVAVNLAISRLRQLHRVTPDGLIAAGDVSVDTQIDVARAVAGLAPRQRKVVVLRHMADLPEREVADLLEISTGTVKRHLHRALATPRSPASSLAADYSTTTKEKDLMSMLQAMFAPAVEPPGGWPVRPWDHRFLEDEDSVVRVAVDQSGSVVLDAAGDEVQSGPGFDHEVAKIRRGRPMPGADDLAVPIDRLAPELRAVLQRAQRMGSVFGHCWVGTEHLGLALAEHPSHAREVVGASWDILAAAIAQFYEGPYAAARLDLVTERLAGDWMPPPLPSEVAPAPNWALRQLLQLAVHSAEAARRAHADALELIAPTGWSLVGHLLGSQPAVDRDP